MYSLGSYPQFGAGSAPQFANGAAYGGSSYGGGAQYASKASYPASYRESYAGSGSGYAQAPASSYTNAQPVSSARYVSRERDQHADVLGLLQKTLAEKDGELAQLRQEAARNQQKFEQQLQETRSLAVQKSKHISALEAELARLQRQLQLPQKAPRRLGEENLHQVGQPSQPLVPYKCVNKDDQVDGSLECWYNQTNAEVDFKRINRGIYLFGSTQVEIDVINHKLMARTEDGWNRGKYAPIEKFLATYEPLEISRRARGKK